MQTLRAHDARDELERNVESIAAKAGPRTRTTARNGRWQVANRIVIEELEAWSFGDWQAVAKAYPRVPPSIHQQQKYRDPDDVRGGTCEAFERALQRVGYFKNGLRKTEAARILGKHLDPGRKPSRSFQAFRDVLLNAA